MVQGIRLCIILLLSVICLVALFTTGCTKSATGRTKQVEIIAHRGASHLAPENTMASVMLGWEKGADVEVDIYLTKDDRIVVIHDRTTKRTGDQDFKVSETTFQQLRTVDVGTFKSGQFAGEKIPLLDEVIATIPHGRKLFIEIKCGQEVLAHLENVIDASGKRSQAVIIAFNFATISAAKKMMPDIPMYWLRSRKKDKDTGNRLNHNLSLIEKARSQGLDGLNLRNGGITQELVDAANAAGLKVYVWTVDDVDEAMKMISIGVEGITTNRPGWMKDQLETLSGD